MSKRCVVRGLFLIGFFFFNSILLTSESDAQTLPPGILPPCANGEFSDQCRYIDADQLYCYIGGGVLGEGESVVAYQNATVGYGGSCMPETRICRNGVLSGSYSHFSCSVTEPMTCAFNGQTVNDGASVNAYQNSSVSYGELCVQEVRTCVNGSLSGSYAHSSCAVGAPMACLFNGETVPNGGRIFAYQNSTVAYGEMCVQERRSCINGVLSGSYSFASCTPGQPMSCQFNGAEVPHGSTAVAYQNSSAQFGGACLSENRACDNGVLSGSYNFGSCAVDQPNSCQFNGKDVAHGEVIKAFQNSTVAFGGVCTEENRVCENGALSGSYAYSSCAPGEPMACLFDGKTVAHGQSVKAFSSSTVPFGGVCSEEIRTCANGVLSGSNTFPTCSVGVAASCSFNGQNVAHGAGVVAYSTSTVAFGGVCATQTRVCTNGALSGSYSFGSCTVGQPAACLFNGKTVAHGEIVKAFQTATVQSGQTCKDESRLCQNGTLSGSYQNASCAVQSGPPSCGENQPRPGSCKIKGSTTFSPSGNGYYKNDRATLEKLCRDKMGEDAKVQGVTLRRGLSSLDRNTGVIQWRSNRWEIGKLSDYLSRSRPQCGGNDNIYNVELISSLACNCR